MGDQISLRIHLGALRLCPNHESRLELTTFTKINLKNLTIHIHKETGMITLAREEMKEIEISSERGRVLKLGVEMELEGSNTFR